MNCAKRVCVYAICSVLSVCTQGVAVFGKDGEESKDLKKSNPITSNVSGVTQFQWSDHSKLSWDDFRGPVNAASDESAAATHCGIGFTTTDRGNGNLPLITVYNNFYINKSWVRADAKIPQILEHEQGHFDLCEIYTRKLRHAMANIKTGTADMKATLMKVFNDIDQEYENRQQAYEHETVHGTNIPNQKKWGAAISRELAEVL